MSSLETTVDGIAKNLDGLTTKVDGLAQRTDGLTKTVDRILAALVYLQEKAASHDGRLERIESILEKTITKLDGFLHILNRHDTEIVALQSSRERMDADIGALKDLATR